MIVKLQDGGIYYRQIPTRNYEKSEGDTEPIKQMVQETRDWMSNWYTKRKATGKYDDQLQDMDFIQNRIKNTPITVSSNYTESAGKFVSPSKESLGAITLYSNPEKMEGPSYNRKLKDNITHELGHAATMYKAQKGGNYSSMEQANEAAKQNVTPSVHKVNSIMGGNLVPMGGDYEMTSAEIIAKLMSMRKAAKMDPTKTHSYEDNKYWLKQFNLDFGKEKSEALMNDVAHHKVENKANKSLLVKKGAKVHKPFGNRSILDNWAIKYKHLKNYK